MAEEKKNTRRNLGTIFLLPVPKMCNNADKNKIMMTKVGIYIRRMTHKLHTQFVSDSSEFTH